MGSDSLMRGKQPTQPQTTSSGEHVTYNHFNAFMEEFRHHTSAVHLKLDELRTRMSEGSTRFAVQATELAAVKESSDEHSDAIKALQSDKLTRDAIQQQLALAAQPRKTMWESVQTTVVTAAILGVLAVAYNMWRDHEFAQRLSVMKAPVSAPANAVPTGAP